MNHPPSGTAAASPAHLAILPQVLAAPELFALLFDAVPAGIAVLEVLEGPDRR